MRVRRSFNLILLLAAAVLVMEGVGRRAERPRGQDAANAAASPGAAETIGGLPEDLDLALVVDNAAQLRSTPVGAAALRFLGDSGSLKDIQDAWTALAGQLGWSEREAFDRLLGRRVVLASRAIDQGRERRWAILSDVSIETEQRLKERLQVAPRAIDQGHQILSVEGGRFELTSHRGAARALRGGPAGGEAVTLVLAPAGRSELFDQIVSGLAGGGGGVGGARTLAKSAVLQEVAKAGPAEFLLLARLDTIISPAGAADPWKDFVVVAGRRAELVGEERGEPGSTWQSRVLVRDTTRQAELKEIQPTTDAAFRALEPDSLLAIVQAAPLTEVLGPGQPFANVLDMLPLPEQARANTVGSQALTIRAVEPRDRISCTVAMQTNDPGELARTMDGAISRGIQALEQRLGTQAPPPRDYGGLAPQAPRTVPLRMPDDSLLRSVFTEPLVVSWCYPQSPCALGGVNAATDAPKPGEAAAHPGMIQGAAGGNPGWWAMTVSQSRDGDAPSPSSLLARDAAALLKDGGGEVARWVCIASARPSRLEHMLPASLPDFRGVRSGMRRFDKVGLRLRITDAGDIQGDLSIRLAPTPQ